MELINLYLKSSRVYQLNHVLHMWNEGKVSATPKIADFIEKNCGITRYDFYEKRKKALESNSKDANLVAEAFLAFTITCIDYQEFDTLNDTLKDILEV